MEVSDVRALVVYESMFGNTQKIAVAVGEGIATVMPAETVEVASAPTTIPDDVALLVIGGPTHGHGLAKAASRASAAKTAGDGLVSRGLGLDEWIERVGPARAPAAVFDTRIKGPGFLWGSAAKAAAKRLAGRGFRLAEQPESFLVGGPTGPQFDRVVEGEVERARAWGASVARRLPVAAGAR
jgi:hypothetical protein